MNVFDALWRVYLAAGTGGRAVMAVTVFLAAGRAAGCVVTPVRDWVSARYELAPLSWRVWQARLRYRVFGPGRRVTCPDGAQGVVGRTWQPPRGGQPGRTWRPVALVTFRAGDRPPRIERLEDLAPRLPNPRVAAVVAAVLAAALGVPVTAGPVTAVLIPWSLRTAGGAAAVFGAALAASVALLVAARWANAGPRLLSWVTAGGSSAPGQPGTRRHGDFGGITGDAARGGR
jgi:hypothetical protein